MGQNNGVLENLVILSVEKFKQSWYTVPKSTCSWSCPRGHDNSSLLRCRQRSSPHFIWSLLLAKDSPQFVSSPMQATEFTTLHLIPFISERLTESAWHEFTTLHYFPFIGKRPTDRVQHKRGPHMERAHLRNKIWGRKDSNPRPLVWRPVIIPPCQGLLCVLLGIHR